MFLLSTFVIFAATAGIPLFVRWLHATYPNIKLYDSYSWLPFLAACLFVSAFFLPNIHISSETSTFQQHFTGGGIYTACLYLYFKKLLGWRLSVLASLVVLLAWTSTFGVANELLEFTLTKLNLANIGSGDTDWDLLANTLGSLTGYVILSVLRIERN